MKKLFVDGVKPKKLSRQEVISILYYKYTMYMLADMYRKRKSNTEYTDIVLNIIQYYEQYGSVSPYQKMIVCKTIAYNFLEKLN